LILYKIKESSTNILVQKNAEKNQNGRQMSIRHKLITIHKQINTHFKKTPFQDNRGKWAPERLTPVWILMKPEMMW